MESGSRLVSSRPTATPNDAADSRQSYARFAPSRIAASTKDAATAVSATAISTSLTLWSVAGSIRLPRGPEYGLRETHPQLLADIEGVHHDIGLVGRRDLDHQRMGAVRQAIRPEDRH